MARPRKDLNWDIIQKRMEAGNSAITIAESHFIDINTFYRRFKEHYGCSFADYADKFHSMGKANIAFTQYMKALSGNTHMLTLLGREWLNQGKEEEIKKSPYEDMLALRHENMLLKAELEGYKEHYDADKS